VTVGEHALPAEVERAADALSHLDVDASLLAAFRRGAAALAAGQLPLIVDTPHPSVCRTCGHVALGEVAEKCPRCGAWPGTYQRFMPNYWFDALEPLGVVQTLRQTPAEVAALLAGLPEAALARPPQEGGWAIRNIVTHLRDAQQVFAFRLDLVLQEEHPLLEMKAVWTWAAREEERPPTTAEIFEVYMSSRAEALAKLEAMPLPTWWRTGQHEEFGAVSLRQQASYFASHELTHLPAIERLRRETHAGSY
jgi:predicted Zn-ribbon and HTH transcriptional regulator